MSTRCNIKIVDENRVVWLYRHCDGYLAETGADLVETFGNRRWWAGQDATDLAQTLLRHGIYEGPEIDNADGSKSKQYRMNYELTNNIHGDIEHLYVLRLVIAPDRVGKVIEWGHAAGFGPSLQDANLELIPLPKFIEKINAERRATNARYDMLCKQSPAYAKMLGSDRYTMLEVPA